MLNLFRTSSITDSNFGYPNSVWIEDREDLGRPKKIQFPSTSKLDTNKRKNISILARIHEKLQINVKLSISAIIFTMYHNHIMFSKNNNSFASFRRTGWARRAHFRPMEVGDDMGEAVWRGMAAGRPKAKGTRGYNKGRRWELALAHGCLLADVGLARVVSS